MKLILNTTKKSVMVNDCSFLNHRNFESYVYAALYAHNHKHIYVVLVNREIYESHEKLDAAFFLR